VELKNINLVIKNTAVLYVKIIINILVAFYTTRVVLNLLGQEDYGIWSLIGGLIALFSVVYSAMTTASMRFMSFNLGTGNNDLIKRTFNSTLLLHLLIGIIFLIIIELLGYFMFDSVLVIPKSRISDAKLVFHATIAITFLYIITVPVEAVINSHENIVALAIFDIFGTLLRLLAVIYLNYVSENLLVTYSLLTLGAQVIITIIKQVYGFKKYDEISIDLKKYYDSELIRKIINFTLWNFLGSISGVLTNHFKGLILNVFFGVKLNTPNGIAQNISSQISQFSDSMTLAINPQLVKSEGRGNRSEMLKLTQSSTKYTLFIFSILVMPIFLELPFLIKTWLKIVPEFTILFCKLILINLLIEKSTFEITNAIRAVGNVKNFQLTEAVIRILNLPLCYLFLKLGYSPNIIFYISITISFIIVFERLFFGKRLIGLDVTGFLLHSVIPPILVLIISVFLTYCLQSLLLDGYIRFFVVSIFGTLISFILFWIIGLKINEKETIKRLFVNFKT
jgi:O-antigen/teichoic acid export membrane protein